MDSADVLAEYDARLRARTPVRLPAGVAVDRDGPLLRLVGQARGGLVVYRDLGGLDGPRLDRLIASQVAFFTARGEAFEWKLHGHDRPADLARRLRAAGLVAEPEETVMVAAAAGVAASPVAADGVLLRMVHEPADLERIGALEAAVWDDDRSWLAPTLERELAVDPAGLTVVVAESGGTIVCSAWMRFAAGTRFATLHGAATLPTWRRRGIYRAVVAVRARLAVERGFSTLLVDASSDSRPILAGLGFVAITTTTPYVWLPPGASMPRCGA